MIALAPVLIASATADPDLLRQFFPTLLHRPPPAPAMPHVTIRQYHGGFGKRAMQRRRPALIERAQYEMQDLGKGGLTITYKQHAPAFREALGGANVGASWRADRRRPLPPRRQGADFRRTVLVRSRDCPDCQLRGRPHMQVEVMAELAAAAATGPRQIPCAA